MKEMELRLRKSKKLCSGLKHEAAVLVNKNATLERSISMLTEAKGRLVEELDR